jgi:hypothetical protein
MVKVPDATALLLYPEATAMASTVVVAETAIGEEVEKTEEPVVGVVPFVV